jgi:hypothetical protein
MTFAETFVQMPTGLAIDSRNHIFVSDPTSRMVHEFQLINTTAEDSHPTTTAPPKDAAPGEIAPR